MKDSDKNRKKSEKKGKNNKKHHHGPPNNANINFDVLKKVKASVDGTLLADLPPVPDNPDTMPDNFIWSSTKLPNIQTIKNIERVVKRADDNDFTSATVNAGKLNCRRIVR